MTYYIWAEPTATGAAIKTGTALPDAATSHESATTSALPADMAAKIASRNGSLDFPSCNAADEALAAQAMATRSGL